MKLRWSSIVLITLPLVVFAAEQAPPKELLDNIDFFQHMDLIKDDQFVAQAAHDAPVDVDLSTSAVDYGGLSHAQNQ